MNLDDLVIAAAQRGFLLVPGRRVLHRADLCTLEAMTEGEWITTLELAERLHRARSNARRCLRHCEEHGLVELSNGFGGTTAHRWKLTEAGVELWRRLAPGGTGSKAEPRGKQ